MQWAKQFDEPAPKDWNEFKYWAQKLIAQLQDAHTSIIENRFSGFVPPYRGRLYETGIILDRVPFNSDADQAGVAPGWMVRVEDSLRWLTTTGAIPQQYRQIAARKALTVNHDYQRFTAFSPDGSQQISWDENPQQLILRDIVDVNQMDDCITYIGLRSFSPVPGLLSLFKDVCASSSKYSHMLLDLRGNVGGSIVLARELQSLFLREKTQIGSASFTDGCGHLGPVFARYTCPSSNARWLGTLEILIDSMTYSATEDFILGLKGLSHVSVRGERTGGGSGRPRSVPIGPDLSLRISTAITFEKGGSPVEHFGIEPDVAEPLR